MYQTEPNFLDWFFLKIYNLLTNGISISGPGPGFLKFILFILIVVGLFFLGVTIYSVGRLKERRAKEQEAYHKKIQSAAPSNKEENKSKNFEQVLNHIKSNNPGDWRIAIIEADNMLDALTKKLGLVGEDLGERLKNASADHFRTLDNAWQAHKVRNRIAHEGLSFDLSYREAKKTIELYESVFREFGVI